MWSIWCPVVLTDNKSKYIKFHRTVYTQVQFQSTIKKKNSFSFFLTSQPASKKQVASQSAIQSASKKQVASQSASQSGSQPVSSKYPAHLFPWLLGILLASHLAWRARQRSLDGQASPWMDGWVQRLPPGWMAGWTGFPGSPWQDLPKSSGEGRRSFMVTFTKIK